MSHYLKPVGLGLSSAKQQWSDGTTENHRIKGHHPQVDTLLRYLLSPGHEDCLHLQGPSPVHTPNPAHSHSLLGQGQHREQRGITSVQGEANQQVFPSGPKMYLVYFEFYYQYY